MSQPFDPTRARLFGHFLVDEGIVARTTVIRALGVQQTRQTPLGQLAIQHGFLDVHQVFEILGVESENPHRLFGSVARDLGHLTEGQVDRLIELQKDTRPPLGEILVEFGSLDETSLETHLANYHATADC